MAYKDDKLQEAIQASRKRVAALKKDVEEICQEAYGSREAQRYNEDVAHLSKRIRSINEAMNLQPEYWLVDMGTRGLVPYTTTHRTAEIDRLTETADDREALHALRNATPNRGKMQVIYATGVKHYSNYELACEKSAVSRQLDIVLSARDKYTDMYMSRAQEKGAELEAEQKALRDMELRGHMPVGDDEPTEEELDAATIKPSTLPAWISKHPYYEMSPPPAWCGKAIVALKPNRTPMIKFFNVKRTMLVPEVEIVPGFTVSRELLRKRTSQFDLTPSQFEALGI